MSARSSNVDDSNRCLSVMEEHKAQEVIEFLTQESLAAGSVWGDIYRNRFLASVRNPPSGLTPEANIVPAADGGDGSQLEFHPNIRAAKLQESCL